MANRISEVSLITNTNGGQQDYYIEPLMYAGITSGTASAYTISLANFEVINGASLQLTFNSRNSAGATLSVNGSSPVTIYYNGESVAANQIKDQSTHTLIFDGKSNPIRWIIADSDTNTDTTYSAGTGLTLTGTTFAIDSNVVAAKDHTHNLSLAESTDNAAITLAFNKKYKLTAGGKDYIFGTMVKPSYNYSDIGNRPTSIELTGAVTGSVTLNNGNNTISTAVGDILDDRYSAIHQTSWDWASSGTQPFSKYVTFDVKSTNNTAPKNTWFNGFVSSHSDYLASFILNEHRTSNWYVGYEQYQKGSSSYTAPTWYLLAHSGNVETGTDNGEIKIAGVDVKVQGLDTAAYKSDSYFAKAEHGTHVTTATVQSALGVDNSTTNQWLNKKGEWSTLPVATNSAFGVVQTGNGITNTDGVISVTASNLGLSNAMHFIGIANKAITDGGTEDPTIDGYSTKTAGDVVIDKDTRREYVWSTANKWELLGFDASTKYEETTSDNTFISKITQATDGTITAESRALDTRGEWSGNAVTATTATSLSDNPSLAASGNDITVTAGGKTSGAFTVPYATKALNDVDGNAIKTRYVTVYNTHDIGKSSTVTFTDLAAAGNAVGMIYAATDNPEGKATWVHGISLAWKKGTTSSWISQIALGVNSGTGMWYRTTQGDIAGKGWTRILDSANYDSLITEVSNRFTAPEITATRKMVINTGKVYSNITGSNVIIGKGTARLFGDGLAISNPATQNDAGWLRVLGTGEADTVFEIATGDDGGAGEQIVARQYTTSNTVNNEAILLGKEGETNFPVSVTTPATITDTLSISSTALESHIKFARNNWNYITYPNDSNAALAIGFGTGDNTNQQLVIQKTGTVRPGSNGAQNLGDSTHKWNDIYATNLYGDASGLQTTSITSEAEIPLSPAGAIYTGSGSTFTGSLPGLAYGVLMHIGATQHRSIEIWATSKANRNASQKLYWRHRNADGSDWAEERALLDEVNTYVADTNTISLARNTETTIATINGNALKIKLPKSDNTWRGIQDNLTSSSNTTESLSAKQGYLLANGSARDDTKLPLAGGTMTGDITFNSQSSAYNSSNIIFSSGGIIGGNTSGGVGIYASTIYLRGSSNNSTNSSQGILISGTQVDPYGDNAVSLGTSTLRYKNIHSVTFTGNLTGNVTGNVSGSAGSVAWANTGHPDTFPPSSHTHPVSEITWAGGQNLTTSATANGQEWSLDLSPGSYTGTYWHVWSTPKGASILRCYTDDRHITMPGNIASTSTSTGTLQVTGGIGVSGQVTATRLAAGGSNTSYNLYVDGTSYLDGTTTVNSALGLGQTSGTGTGFSLYGGAKADGSLEYGIMFAKTATFGKLGSVSSDWATYFTMNRNDARGWIFKSNGGAANGNNNVASIAGNGNIYTQGNITIKEVTLQWNSTDSSLDFVFA